MRTDLWTDDERATLRRLWGCVSVEALRAALPGRTPDACRRQASNLYLPGPGRGGRREPRQCSPTASLTRIGDIWLCRPANRYSMLRPAYTFADADRYRVEELRWGAALLRNERTGVAQWETFEYLATSPRWRRLDDTATGQGEAAG
jgi:hypothetical protein